MKVHNLVRARGFSLLEVLIAVVVLSFGLLALASLQASLMRNSSEAKARSVALSLAKDRVEELRSFSSLADYQAMTDTTGTYADDGAGSLGGVSYSVTTTVERYAYDPDPDGDPDTDDGVFELVAGDTGALGSDYAADNEFKTIEVTVGWTDSDGTAQTVTIEDAIGAVAPENSGRLARRKPDSAARKPVVLIQDPSSDAGVIPIAIGDGSETAATNPRPVIDTETAQTSYDVYTYAALLDGSGNAQAQSRVETRVVGCRCDFGQADADGVAYRPTYWDGERYVAPEEAGTPIAGEANLTGGDPTQSILCSSCCRDHHDPVSGSGPKFSPRRDSHEHFDDITADPVTSGEYWEACRMIRSDGIFRVATDPYNEYTNVLKTAVASGETEPFTDPAPDSAASDSYVDFVIDYLSTQALQVSPNTQLSQDAADTKAEDAGINIEPVDLELPSERWMHSRGLYIDWLEAEAIEAIGESQQDCPDNLTSTDCLLRVLPFTSINTTELSAWSPRVDAGESIYVANDDFALSTLAGEGEEDPVRGRLTAVAPGAQVAAATIATSAAGLLADPDFVVNPNDEIEQTNNIADQPDSDGQEFVVAGPACGFISGDAVDLPKGSPVVTPQLITGTCDGSDAERSLATTRVRLRLTLGDTDPPGTASAVLTGPGGQSYSLASQSWDSLDGTHVFSAVGTPTTGGTWTLSLTANYTGQAKSETISFSVDFLYSEMFDVQLSNYDFGKSPSFGSTLVTCDPITSSNNPSECGTTDPGAADSVVLTEYNYEYTGTAQNMTCPDYTGAGACTTTKHCKNFDISSVSVNGTALTGTPTVSSLGRSGESTTISFPSGLVQDDIVLITFGTPNDTAPACQFNGGAKNKCVSFSASCE